MLSSSSTSSCGQASSRLAKIVRMTQILNKWKRLRRSHRGYSSLLLSLSPTDMPVPAGCIPIYVGSAEEEKEGIAKTRYILKIKDLQHPLLQSLLEKAEEEYGGFQYEGGPLTIPCHTSVFEHVLSLLSQRKNALNRCRLVSRPFLSHSLYDATIAL